MSDPSRRDDAAPSDSGYGASGGRNSNAARNTDSPADPASESLVGIRLNDYQVLRRLGRGGMADVYVAVHQDLERQVALKVLRRQLAVDQEYVERFRREARAAAKLNHPHIVQVYEVGRCGDLHYIAQELIDGLNLKDQVERHGPLEPQEAVVVLHGVAQALAAAHRCGITHRDVKPENLLKATDGMVKVADFGLARVGGSQDLTQAGLTMGTPRYMSPEQVQGHAVGPASDVYSLGCTMYFLLTGQPPFDGQETLAVALQHLHETSRPLAQVRGADDVPQWLVAGINQMLAKDPAERFASASEIVQWLDHQAEAVVDPLAISGGVAQATSRLQQARVAERLRLQKQTRRRQLLMLVPLLGLALGGYAAMPSGPPAILQWLRPDRVPARQNVEEQYLAAVSRNDVAAWDAVSEHFPPEQNANNQAYAIKAQLQKARLLAQQGQTDPARQLLRDLSASPDADRLYRLVALAELYDLYPAQSESAQRIWAELRLAYQAVTGANPDTARSLWAILGAEKMQRLESS